MLRLCGLRRMSFRPFTSESYAERDRPEAWRDVLNTVGLQPLSMPTFLFRTRHGLASRRKGVTLVQLAAGSQGVAPLAAGGDDALPIALLPIEDGVVLRSGGHQIVPAGHLLLLPPHGDWTLLFQRDLRAIALHVTTDAFRGRKTGRAGWIEPRAVAPQGFAGVFARALDRRRGRSMRCPMWNGTRSRRAWPTCCSPSPRNWSRRPPTGPAARPRPRS